MTEPAAPAPATPSVRQPITELSVGRASGIMALGTIASRFTGFLRQAILAAAIGSALVGNAYAVANTLPNIVYELLLGGVLTSVVVPLLVKARQEDPDGGRAYEQRLLTLAVLLLAAATAAAVVIAPLLTAAYSASDADEATRDLTTVLAYLVLPEIFFYGVGALLGAVLNTRGHFAAPMWAPVLNNVVVIATAATFIALPGAAQLNPATITRTQTLVLGVGTTLGIVAQSIALWPALRRVGFRWRFRFDFHHSRLGEARQLAGWILCYVLVSQVGVWVITRLASAAASNDGPGNAIYTNANLLFMLPHGIVAVSLITALLPRMSRAAVEGRFRAIGDDLALGSRLSAAVLIPIAALLLFLGSQVAVVVYAHGETNLRQGQEIGDALAFAAIGLFPYAVSQIQIFVFYALRDARTPVLVNVVAVAVKVAVDVVSYELVSPEHVVEWLMIGNTVSYLLAAVIGYLLLQRRLAVIHVYELVRTIVRVVLASIPLSVAAVAVAFALHRVLGAGLWSSLVQLIAATALGGAVYLGFARLFRIREINDVLDTVRARLAR